MKKHGTSNILLIELVLVILFFMLCASVIVEAFGGARLKSREARSRSEAMMTVENLEARLAGEENAEGMLESSGFLPEEDRWVLREKDYTLTAEIREEKTGAGILRTVAFAARQGNGAELFELPVTHYLPGEVSP